MLSKLGEALPEAVLRDAMPEMDPENTVRVCFHIIGSLETMRD